MSANIDLDGGIALLGALGTLAAGAAYLSMQDDDGEQAPTFNIGEGFGREDDGAEDGAEDGGLTDTPGITDPDTSDPTEGDWNYEDPTNDPTSPEYEPPDLDFGAGVDDGADEPAGDWTYEGDVDAASDTTTGGTTPVGETGLIDPDELWGDTFDGGLI